jgi:phage terminase small subunit
MRTRIPRPPRWRAPFLRALAATGNVKLSAGRAPVHHSHVYRLRRKDAGFAAAWDVARAEAAERLANNPSPSFAKCTGDPIHGELVLTRTRRGRAHLRVPRANGWTLAKEKTFLKALASSCNVTVAAKTAGVSASGAYQRRLRWPGFEGAWAEAIDSGMMTLESKLLDAAVQNLAYADAVLPDDIPLVSTDQAISLLTIHRRQLAGDVRRGGHIQRATEKETNAAIVRQLRKLKQSYLRAEKREARLAELRT